MRWLRLYHETPSDPKLRRIAHTSGTTVGHVLAVWVSMMCHASELEGDKRGTLEGWDDTDCAINLGIDPAIVFAIRREMEARLLDGKKLMAWEKRQYDSDSAAVRTKRWREKKIQQNQGAGDAVTACDVTVTAKSREEEKREERKEEKKEVAAQPSAARAPRGSRLPLDWKPEPDEAGYAHKLGLDPSAVAENFRDYWHARPGKEAVKLDWSATWRGWCRRDAERKPTNLNRSTEKPRPWWLEDMIHERH